MWHFLCSQGSPRTTKISGPYWHEEVVLSLQVRHCWQDNDDQLSRECEGLVGPYENCWKPTDGSRATRYSAGFAEIILLTSEVTITMELRDTLLIPELDKEWLWQHSCWDRTKGNRLIARFASAQNLYAADMITLQYHLCLRWWTKAWSNVFPFPCALLCWRLFGLSCLHQRTD